MIPAFDSHGLLPPGEHLCTLDEAAERFACNDHRRGLWAAMLECLEALQMTGVRGHVVIDGSFVTDKTVPDDIEISLDARGQPDDIQGLALLWCHRHYAHWKRRGVSVHPTLADEVDFTLFFQYLGPTSAGLKRLDVKHPKGILRSTQW